MIPGEMRELRTLDEAASVIDEWMAAYLALWRDYVRLNDQLIDAKLDREMADARAVVLEAEQILKAHPAPHKFADEVEA